MTRLRQSDLERLRCRQCRAPLVALDAWYDIVDLDPDNTGYCANCWTELCNMDSDGILAFISKRYENDNER